MEMQEPKIILSNYKLIGKTYKNSLKIHNSTSLSNLHFDFHVLYIILNYQLTFCIAFTRTNEDTHIHIPTEDTLFFWFLFHLSLCHKLIIYNQLEDAHKHTISYFVARSMWLISMHR